MRPRHLATAALLALAGCHDPVTEIVVVVDSDPAVPNDVQELQLDVDAPAGLSRQPFDLSARGSKAFPATLGLVPGDTAGYGPFDVTVSLLDHTAANPLIATRKATGVRFVRGETRVLFLGLPRACACQGTSCPNALEASCADLVDPMLAPFDPKHLPRVIGGDAGVVADGGADAASIEGGGDGTTADAPDDHPALEAGADLASSDGAKDAPGDAVAEAPRVRLPRGQACGSNDACQSLFCVDGVCCESACTCGTCSATPGTCAAAGAGTDPHGDCGSFTCNGAGACETTCAEGFGACSTHCAPAAHCDGAGVCVPSTTEAGLHCVVGSCMCKPPLTCPAPDGGGAGVCQ